MLWLTIWFMVVLKIPALYLCYVIWWAVKDPPTQHADGGSGNAGGGPRRGPRAPAPGRHPGPHGSPVRRMPRTAPLRVASKKSA